MIGTVTKGLLSFEGALTEAILVLTSVLTEEGCAVYKMALGGKKLSTCSLGDKRQLLVSLKERFREGIILRRLECPQNLLDGDELSTISRLATLRNNLLHGKLGFHTDLPADQFSSRCRSCSSSPAELTSANPVASRLARTANKERACSRLEICWPGSTELKLF